MVGGVTAALLEGQQLAWEENGLSLMVITPGLDVAALVQVAESLEPAR
jgi:hypothetical protein